MLRLNFSKELKYPVKEQNNDQLDYIRTFLVEHGQINGTSFRYIAAGLLGILYIDQWVGHVLIMESVDK